MSTFRFVKLDTCSGLTVNEWVGGYQNAISAIAESASRVSARSSCARATARSGVVLVVGIQRLADAQ